MNNIEELLQKYFNESDHYLAPEDIKFTETVLKGGGILYVIQVPDVCEATGYETVEIDQNDLLVWMYNLHDKVITCGCCCTVYKPNQCPECGDANNE